MCLSKREEVECPKSGSEPAGPGFAPRPGFRSHFGSADNPGPPAVMSPGGGAGLPGVGATLIIVRHRPRQLFSPARVGKHTCRRAAVLVRPALSSHTQPLDWTLEGTWLRAQRGGSEKTSRGDAV